MRSPSGGEPGTGGLSDAVVADEEAERILAGLEHDFPCDAPHEDGVGSAEKSMDPKVADARGAKAWSENAGLLPTEIGALFSRVRKDGLRAEAFRRAEGAVLWGASDLDNERRERLWRGACRGQRRQQTLSTVRKAIDGVLSVVPHYLRIYKHQVPEVLPKQLHRARVRNGALVVNEPRRRSPSFGVPAYPEWTPPEIVVVTVRELERRLKRRGLARRVAAWDLTAGSGTVRDVLNRMKGSCTSSDLCSLAENVPAIPIQRVGREVFHTGTNLHEDRWGKKNFDFQDWHLVEPNPTLIFIDPPSRGWPTMTHLTQEDAEASWDLAGFDRDLYIQVVAASVAQAVGCLAPGGLVSLTVREGTRESQRITPDPQLGDEILAAVRGRVGIYLGHRIEHGTIFNQASLGSSRPPMMHFLLERRNA